MRQIAYSQFAFFLSDSMFVIVFNLIGEENLIFLQKDLINKNSYLGFISENFSIPKITT